MKVEDTSNHQHFVTSNKRINSVTSVGFLAVDLDSQLVEEW